MNRIILNLQLECDKIYVFPKKKVILHWLNNIILAFRKKAEITIRIVNEKEISELNLIYLGKNKSTNILAFPFINFPKTTSILLGDLIICYPIINYEAINQLKSFESHLAHMIIHGSLHLLGFDHNSYYSTTKMENLEIKIMNKLGYLNPYIKRNI